jgi:hypothetical protein
MSEKCLICKFHGKNTPSVSTSTIYQASQNQYIHLCYSHSVEFFKMGQVKFVLKYQHDFREHGLSSKDLLRNQSAEGLLTTFR